MTRSEPRSPTCRGPLAGRGDPRCRRRASRGHRARRHARRVLGESGVDRARERLTRGWDAAVGQPRYGPATPADRRRSGTAAALSADRVRNLASTGTLRAARRSAVARRDVARGGRRPPGVERAGRSRTPSMRSTAPSSGRAAPGSRRVAGRASGGGADRPSAGAPARVPDPAPSTVTPHRGSAT